jgi:hypothetical protein
LDDRAVVTVDPDDICNGSLVSGLEVLERADDLDSISGLEGAGVDAGGTGAAGSGSAMVRFVR